MSDLRDCDECPECGLVRPGRYVGHSQSGLGYWSQYPPLAVTVDIVVFAWRQSPLIPKPVLHVALIKRANEPFKDCWALPGGFIDPDEDAETAAARELLEETGLVADSLTQGKTYTAPDRDPRMRTVSISYIAEVGTQEPRAGDDAAEVRLFPVDGIWPTLAFDHATILWDALTGLQRRGLRTPSKYGRSAL